MGLLNVNLDSQLKSARVKDGFEPVVFVALTTILLFSLLGKRPKWPRKGQARFFAPKGLYDSAQGVTP
jgi:hypothetical protein